jgi:hypothetical protein
MLCLDGVGVSEKSSRRADKGELVEGQRTLGMTEGEIKSDGENTRAD